MQLSIGPLATFLARYLRPRLRLSLVLAALLIGSTALQLAGPQVLRAFVDAATHGATVEHLRNVAALFIGLAIVQQACAVLATYYSEVVGWQTTNALREDLAAHCLRLDLSFHKSRTPGELIERIDGDVTALANFFSQFVVRIVGNLLLLLGVIVLLWRVDWRTGLALAVFVAIAAAVMNKMRGITVPYWQRARQAGAELFGYIEERLGGTEDLRASGAGPYAIQRLHQPLRARIITNCRARVIGAVQWMTPDFLSAAQTAVAFMLMYWLFRQGLITLGTALMVYQYTWLSFMPLRVITNQMEDLQKAGAGLVRIQELWGERSALLDPPPGAALALPAGALLVEFDGVSFAYGDELRASGPLGKGAAPVDDAAADGETEREPAFVLHDVSFTLAPGAVLGLLGRTGSGKTTISRLLFRLYDPEAGCIRLGGVNLKDARRDDVRARVGMVTQDVQLFRATVRDNVTLFDETVPDQRIVAAFAELGLRDWYESLPQGLDTILGAGAAGASAGEAQLLAFTRVFLRDPGLVILDEASSRLDPATERLIERAVDRLLAGRTGIIVAHRLGTIRRAGQIVILDEGRIAEAGPRQALAGDPTSRLAGLLRTGLEEMVQSSPFKVQREEPVLVEA